MTEPPPRRCKHVVARGIDKRAFCARDALPGLERCAHHENPLVMGEALKKMSADIALYNDVLVELVAQALYPEEFPVLWGALSPQEQDIWRAKARTFIKAHPYARHLAG